MQVYYDESPAGQGKTFRAIRSICKVLCKVIFFTERKKSFGELDAEISRWTAKFGTRPFVRHIHGETDNRGGSVAAEIESLPDRYAAYDHVIVITTHAALLRSNLSRFAGWRAVIDEVPAFLDFEEKRTHLDADFFTRHYQLEHVVDRWHAVTLTDEGKKVSATDVWTDDSHSHLRTFHARVTEASRPDAKRAVLSNIADWREMSDKKIQWCWASVFSLWELEAFDRVELLGNRFRSDIGSVLSERLEVGNVKLEALPPPLEARSFAPRRVSIYYFSERPASKSFFASASGQEALKGIGEHLGSALPPDRFIWTANQTAMPGCPTPKALVGLPQTAFLTPRQAGTNEHMAATSAAVIYAAKPTANMLSFLSSMGVDGKAWTRSTEFEAILQFVTRTSVRAEKDGRPVDFWVFDREQAQYLREYFNALPHTTATMDYVPLAINFPSAAKGGRPSLTRSPEEQKAWQAERKRKDAERKRRARRLRRLASQSSHQPGINR